MKTNRPRNKKKTAGPGRKTAAKKSAMGSRPLAASVDEYLTWFPKDARTLLEGLRRIVRTVAARAQEGISYRIPFYKHHGSLVGYAAFPHHVGLYVISEAVLTAHRKELEPYETSKGTVRFPIGQPLPAELVKKLVEARVKENEAAAARRAR